MNSIRNEYSKIGVTEFYKKYGDTYSNPHEKTIHKHLLLILNQFNKNDKILDLCCGSGEVSLFLYNKGFNNISGIDPYTKQNYIDRTGLKCSGMDFSDLSTKGLTEQYNTIICSFAMHLCPKSYLPNLLYQLSLVTHNLIIISPHKKPEINHYFTLSKTQYIDNVYLKIYNSELF